MPGIAHLITGITFAVLIYNADPKRYSKKHAIIFAVMCLLGPDFAHTISLSEFDHRLGHSVLGWPIYCVYLVPIFVFITRFTADYKIHNMTDEGPNSGNQLNWLQVYLILVAGGFFHFTVDILMETKRFWPLPLDDPIYLNILFFRDNLQNWSILGIDASFMGIIFYVLIALMFFFFMKGLSVSGQENNNQYLNSAIALFVFVYLALFVIFGNSGGENDFGGMLFPMIFFFLPFGLNLAARSPSENKNPKPNSNVFVGMGLAAAFFMIIVVIVDNLELLGNLVVILRMIVFTLGIKLIDYDQYDPSKAEMKLKLCTAWVFGCAALLLLVPVFGLIFFYEELLTIDFVGENLIWLSILLIIFAILFMIGGRLLLKRDKRAQHILLFPLLITGIIVIPLLVWLILRENEVLELFR